MTISKLKINIHCSRIKIGDQNIKPGHQLHRVVFYYDGSVSCKQHSQKKDFELLEEYKALKAISGSNPDLQLPACCIIESYWKSIIGNTQGRNYYRHWVELTELLVQILPKALRVQPPISKYSRPFTDLEKLIAKLISFCNDVRRNKAIIMVNGVYEELATQENVLKMAKNFVTNGDVHRNL